jgi:SAM-dependent methyltransferase
MEIDLLNLYPRSKRPIDERAKSITEARRAVAREFGRDYFDGDRLYGYGGYAYHPRFWTGTVKRFRDHYRLASNASVLDVGCAKGFMLHDFKLLMADLNISGVDISEYAIKNSMETVTPCLQVANAKKLPFPDRSFDLVISINTIHNLSEEECRQALAEIQRVTRKHAFVTVDAWRTEEERERLFKWNLTALTMKHTNDWKKFFKDAGYGGDYYWFIAD